MKTKWTLFYTDEEGMDAELTFEGPFALHREDAGFACEGWTPVIKGNELKSHKAGPQTISHDDYGLTCLTQINEEEVILPERIDSE